MANSNSSEDLDKWMVSIGYERSPLGDWRRPHPYEPKNEYLSNAQAEHFQSLIKEDRERLLDAIGADAPKDCPTSGFGARSHSKTMNNLNAAWRAVLAKYRKGKVG
jgi:hypothetical protein